MYSSRIQYIGCDDASLDLFESQYILPDGMCYNSYVLLSDKIAVMDTVDPRKTDEWLARLQEVLNGKTPDYLVVQHMEPDHSGSLSAFLQHYPNTTIVAGRAAFQYMPQFGVSPVNKMVVNEGDALELGNMTLQFIAAPMVHWPEVIMTYVPQEKTLFSADGFGKFGVYHADEDDWACEARRYYFNICGRYGKPVEAVLNKASNLDIATIAPLHGPVLDGDKMAEALRLYSIWSKYEVETEGVLVAFASIHGHTAAVAECIADRLQERGAGRVVLADLSREDMAEVIEDAFRMDRMVLCCATYDGDIFPPMHQFLYKLGRKGYQNRKVALVENGTWSPQAVRVMKEMLAPMANIEIVEPTLTVKSLLRPENMPALETIVDAMCIK